MVAAEIVENAADSVVAQWLHAHLSDCLERAPGRIAITLPGGSTPFPILAELARLPLDWSRIDVWPGDDRIVPADHPASNVGRIRAALAPLGARIVPLAEGLQPPRFALAWLGMGADGHIASLFPNTDPQVDDPLPLRRIVPDPLPPEAPFERFSLTIPALLDSAALVFVIRGADKLALFRAACRGDNDLPVARLIHAARQSVTCFA